MWSTVELVKYFEKIILSLIISLERFSKNTPKFKFYLEQMKMRFLMQLGQQNVSFKL